MRGQCRLLVSSPSNYKLCIASNVIHTWRSLTHIQWVGSPTIPWTGSWSYEPVSRGWYKRNILRLCINACKHCKLQSTYITEINVTCNMPREKSSYHKKHRLTYSFHSIRDSAQELFKWVSTANHMTILHGCVAVVPHTTVLLHLSPRPISLPSCPVQWPLTHECLLASCSTLSLRFLVQPSDQSDAFIFALCAPITRTQPHAWGPSSSNSS